MGTMRLDKFLVEMKKGSRSEVKKLIKSGRVTVDGRTVGNRNKSLTRNERRSPWMARRCPTLPLNTLCSTSLRG